MGLCPTMEPSTPFVQRPSFARRINQLPARKNWPCPTGQCWTVRSLPPGARRGCRCSAHGFRRLHFRTIHRGEPSRRARTLPATCEVQGSQSKDPRRSRSAPCRLCLVDRCRQGRRWPDRCLHRQRGGTSRRYHARHPGRPLRLSPRARPATRVARRVHPGGDRSARGRNCRTREHRARRARSGQTPGAQSGAG